MLYFYIIFFILIFLAMLHLKSGKKNTSEIRRKISHDKKLKMMLF
jgi:hypothetical protein